MSELLPFPYRLRRSARSRTIQFLYSANIAELLGMRRGHQEIYLHPREVVRVLRDRRYVDTDSIDMMVFDRAPPDGWDIVAELRLAAKQPESAHRYEVLDRRGPLSGSVYFPEGMFREPLPETCFVALRWVDLRMPDGTLIADVVRRAAGPTA